MNATKHEHCTEILHSHQPMYIAQCFNSM